MPGSKQEGATVIPILQMGKQRDWPACSQDQDLTQAVWMQSSQPLTLSLAGNLRVNPCSNQRVLRVSEQSKGMILRLKASTGMHPPEGQCRDPVRSCTVPLLTAPDNAMDTSPNSSLGPTTPTSTDTYQPSPSRNALFLLRIQN